MRGSLPGRLCVWASPLRGGRTTFKFVPDEFVVTLPKHNFAGAKLGVLARPKGEGQEGLSPKSPGVAGIPAPAAFVFLHITGAEHPAVFIL